MSHIPNIDLGEETEEGWEEHHNDRGHSLHPYYYDEPPVEEDVDETEPGGKPFDGTDI